jgi:hypothetical protein
MTQPDERDPGVTNRRAWARLLDLLAREVVRRLRPTDSPAGDREIPPAGGADDSLTGGGGRDAR